MRNHSTAPKPGVRSDSGIAKTSPATCGRRSTLTTDRIQRNYCTAARIKAVDFPARDAITCSGTCGTNTNERGVLALENVGDLVTWTRLDGDLLKDLPLSNETCCFEICALLFPSLRTLSTSSLSIYVNSTLLS